MDFWSRVVSAKTIKLKFFISSLWDGSRGLKEKDLVHVSNRSGMAGMMSFSTCNEHRICHKNKTMTI